METVVVREVLIAAEFLIRGLQVTANRYTAFSYGCKPTQTLQATGRFKRVSYCVFFLIIVDTELKAWGSQSTETDINLS